MPVITSGHGCRSDENGKPVPTYRHMMVYTTFIDADFKYIEAQRKLHRRLHDELKVYQKAAGKARDFELARELSDEATGHLRFYRAACLILPYCTGNLPGDCPYITMSMWPVELAPELDSLLNYLDLNHDYERAIASKMQDLDIWIRNRLRRAKI